jgi:hypothetical protein
MRAGVRTRRADPHSVVAVGVHRLLVYGRAAGCKSQTMIRHLKSWHRADYLGNTIETLGKHHEIVLPCALVARKGLSHKHEVWERKRV